MKITHALLSVAAVVPLLGSPALGQPSLADQKLQADIDKAKLDMEAARLKMQLDQQTALNTALAAVRGTTGGQVSVDKPEATAEGLLLTRRLYTGAAAQLADATGDFPADSVPIVMFGTAAPTTADWIAFDNLVGRLIPKVQTAINDWETVERIQQAPAEAKSFGRSVIPALGTAAAVANVVTSVASLFRIDTSMGGTPLTANDQQVRSILAKALADKGFEVDGSGLEIAGEPVRVKRRLATLDGLYRQAHMLYHEQYLPKLAEVKKIEELPAAVALAGKHLEVAIADYETLQRTLFTAVEGVLPATVIERQAKLVDNPNRPIVYIRNHKAALTTLTRKGFLTTLGSSVPVYVNGAAEMDYLLMYRGRVEPGSVVCSIPRTRMTALHGAEMRCERPLPATAAANASNGSAAREAPGGGTKASSGQ